MNEELVKQLRRLLCSWLVFRQKAHTYHWDVTGSDFLPLHNQFKKIYDEAVEYSDQIAERIRQLGAKVEMNLATALGDSSVVDANEVKNAEDMIRDLSIALTQLSSQQIEITNSDYIGKDIVTIDLLTQLTKWTEFENWFLTSLIDGKG